MHCSELVQKVTQNALQNRQQGLYGNDHKFLVGELGLQVSQSRTTQEHRDTMFKLHWYFPTHCAYSAPLQALQFAKDVREAVRDLYTQHYRGLSVQLRSLSPKFETAGGVNAVPGVDPPLIAIYLDRSSAYITAVLAVLASG